MLSKLGAELFNPFAYDEMIAGGIPMKPFPEGFPSFETEDQMYALLQEALDDPDEGVELTEEEWRKLYAELGVPFEERKRLVS